MDEVLGGYGGVGSRFTVEEESIWQVRGTTRSASHAVVQSACKKGIGIPPHCRRAEIKTPSKEEAAGPTIPTHSNHKNKPSAPQHGSTQGRCYDKDAV
jgi:hypothetical protein